MAAMTDPSMPGEADTQPDVLPTDIAPNDLLNAYSAGYSHADITAATGAEPLRPDIGEIWGGTHPADATWTDAASINTDPYKLDTADQARAQINQLAESGAGVGAIESAGLSVAKGLLGRAAQLGVTTTTEDLAAASAGNAIPPVVKYTAAAAAGAGAFRADGLFNDPDQWKKDFASQSSMVNKGMTDEQNRKNRRQH